MRRSPARLLLSLVVCGGWIDGHAIDRIVFEADEVASAAGMGSGVRALLDVSGPEPKLDVTGAEIRRAGVAHPFGSVALHCGRLIVREPRFACDDGSLR